MKKVLYFLLVVLLLGVFLFSGWKLLQILTEYRQSEMEYEELAQYVVIPEATPAAETKETTAEEPQTEEPARKQPQVQWPQVDFDALQAINPDVVGWIYIEGTKVNYPIVQGSDNDYYLYRMISGEYNSAGSIFLDVKASESFLSQNNVIYGHNMRNGSMFADITGYKKQGFYDEHPIALLLTPEKNYVVQLFSGYRTDVQADAWQVSFSEENYAQWLENCVAKSVFTANVTPNTADRVLTFSTCTYETANARFVLHGILIG